VTGPLSLLLAENVLPLMRSLDGKRVRRVHQGRQEVRLLGENVAKEGGGQLAAQQREDHVNDGLRGERMDLERELLPRKNLVEASSAFELALHRNLHFPAKRIGAERRGVKWSEEKAKRGKFIGKYALVVLMVESKTRYPKFSSPVPLREIILGASV